jgi:hypothetical protein
MEMYDITSVEELARRLGYTRGERIQKFLRNEGSRPSFETLEDIARVFADLNMKWLITGEGQPKGAVIPPAKNPRGNVRESGSPSGSPSGQNTEGSVPFVLHSVGEPEAEYGSQLGAILANAIRMEMDTRISGLTREVADLKEAIMALQRQLNDR